MPFAPNVSGNPEGRPKKEKSFAAMLRIAINEATESGGTKLRAVADALVDKAVSGDVPAIKELADRIDGKVPQAIIGDDDEAAISVVATIIRVIHDAKANAGNPDGKDI